VARACKNAKLHNDATKMVKMDVFSKTNPNLFLLLLRIEFCTPFYQEEEIEA
jgi:hypothetical protein